MSLEVCEWVGGSGGCISRKKRKKEGQVDELIFFLSGKYIGRNLVKIDVYKGYTKR